MNHPPEADYHLEYRHPGLPLVIACGFVSWQGQPEYDFINRLQTLEALCHVQFNKIFLRDSQNCWYQRGVRGLGDSVAGVLQALQELIRQLQPPQVITLGQSMGGYGALVLGLLLPADVIISFASLSCLESQLLELIQDHRWLPTLRELEKTELPPGNCPDLVPLLAQKPPHTKVHYVFGSNPRDADGTINLDAVHGVRLRSACPNLQLYPYPQAGHAIVKYLGESHLLNGLLTRLILGRELADLNPPGSEERVSRDWQGWVCENLMRGASPTDLQRVMQSQGFSPHLAQQIVEAMANHPAIPVGKQLYVTGRKREWLLETLDSLAALEPRPVERCKTPSLARFCQEYYSRNRPVILTDAIEAWPARGKWTPAYLRETFGTLTVQIQEQRTQDPHFERHAHQLRGQARLDQFIDRVLAVGESNEFYMTAGNSQENRELIQGLLPDLGDIGDGYLDLTRQDQACLWLGPQGTVTPLHHDLTNNLFIQVYGRKRFLMAPATQVSYLYNHHHVFSELSPLAVDQTKFPAFARAKIYDLVINPGESLFIPIGWWHHVISLEVSISLTLTNFKLNNDFHTTYPRQD